MTEHASAANDRRPVQRIVGLTSITPNRGRPGQSTKAHYAADNSSSSTFAHLPLRQRRSRADPHARPLAPPATGLVDHPKPWPSDGDAASSEPFKRADIRSAAINPFVP